MDVQQMIPKLFGDYEAICTTWEGHLVHLEDKLVCLSEAKNYLDELEAALEVRRSEAVMEEMSSEGRINGSNAAKRKHQTEMLLAELPELDPEYSQMLENAEEIRAKIDRLGLEADMLQRRISALRNQARMISGLAFALGG